jgi:hypothetical protein
MKNLPEKLRLIDDNRVWNVERIAKYLRSKERFLRLLMLSMISLVLVEVELILAIYLTRGQPVRGSELGVIKFQTSNMTLHNFFVHDSNSFYAIEYHKARS